MCRQAVTATVMQALVWLATSSGFAVVSAAAAESSAASTEIGPQEVMSDLSVRLFAALDKDSARVRHNADKVLPLVDGLLAPHFDRQYAARLVLGMHWRGATEDQRQQFGVALYQRLIRTYAGAVAEWTADRVKILPLRADPAALQVTVHTQVTKAGGAVVPVDFRMHLTADGWKIFDVTVDGVSYVRIYHDDTDEEVAQKGLDAAIARLARSDAMAIDRARLPEPPGTR
jgi:phospholipid transport system substrate-binding protein